MIEPNPVGLALGSGFGESATRFATQQGGIQRIDTVRVDLQPSRNRETPD